MTDTLAVESTVYTINCTVQYCTVLVASWGQSKRRKYVVRRGHIEFIRFMQLLVVFLFFHFMFSCSELATRRLTTRVLIVTQGKRGNGNPSWYTTLLQEQLGSM